MTRPVAAALVLSLSCLLAGCGAAPPTDGAATATVDVRVTNDAGTARVVAVSVVPDGFDGVVVEYADRPARTVAASSLDAVPPDAFDGAVSVRVAGENVRTVRYDLPPATGRGETFSVPAGNVTVVYSVAGAAGDRPPSVGVVACGADTARTTLDVRVGRDGRLGVTTTCADRDAVA